MSGRDRFAGLIPFLANGTLGDQESAEARAHLEDCEGCRALLAHSRLELRAKDVPIGALTGHIQSQLLLEYHEAAGSLDQETRSWIASHLGACDLCREALSIAGSVPGEDTLPAAPSGSSRGGGTLWSLLRSSLLAPAPALAYLLVALIGLPLMIWLRPGPATPPSRKMTPRILPPAVVVPGEIAFRRGAGAEPPAPLELDLPGGGGPVRLSLRTDIDREDLDDEEAAFDVRLLDGGHPVWSQEVPGDAFSRTRHLDLEVDPGLLPPRRPLEIEIRLRKPGDPFHDEILFRRTIRARQPGG